MTDALLYNFPAIEQAAADVKSFAQKADSTFQDLHAKYQRLLNSGWHGAAAERTRHALAMLDSSWVELRHDLVRLSSATAQAAEDMRAADNGIVI